MWQCGSCSYFLKALFSLKTAGMLGSKLIPNLTISHHFFFWEVIANYVTERNLHLLDKKLT